MFDEQKSYPTITLQALADFNEDKDAAAQFTRRFLPMALSSVAAFLLFIAFLGIPMFLTEDDDDGSFPKIYLVLAAASLAACIGLFILTWKRMNSDVPVSPKTGQPMEVYQLINPLNQHDHVLIYICRPSRTFFRAVFKSSNKR